MFHRESASVNYVREHLHSLREAIQSASNLKHWTPDLIPMKNHLSRSVLLYSRASRHGLTKSAVLFELRSIRLLAAILSDLDRPSDEHKVFRRT